MRWEQRNGIRPLQVTQQHRVAITNGRTTAEAQFADDNHESAFNVIYAFFSTRLCTIVIIAGICMNKGMIGDK